MLEVKGLPYPSSGKRYMIYASRVSIIAFAILMMAFYLFFLGGTGSILPILLMVVIVGLMLLIMGEFFAHEERRDSSSISIGDGMVVFKNDYIDTIFRRPTEISFGSIEHTELIHRPTEDGYEPYLLIVHTNDGKVIGSGAKEADGLRKAVALLEAEGVRVDELR